MRIKVFLIFLSIYLFSCSTKIDLEIPEAEEQIVVNSLITNDSIISVFITKTIPVLSNKSNIVENAEIKLFADNQFEENLIKINDTLYQSTIETQLNTEYKIEIEVPGFEKISAKTVINDPVSIISGNYKIDSYYVHQQSRYESETEVSFIDNQEINNYYLISFYKLSYGGYKYDHDNNVWVPMDSTNINYQRIRYLNSNDPIVVNEGDLDFMGDPGNIRYLVFSDEMLSQNNTINLLIGGGLSEMGEVHVLIRNINYDLYKYYKSLIRQQFNSGMLSVDLNNMFLTNNPNDLYSNIENGLGIFAGYSETDFKLTLIE